MNIPTTPAELLDCARTLKREDLAFHEAAIATVQAQERPDRDEVLAFLREQLAKDRAALDALPLG